jgi:hypothetical protein
MENVSSPRTSVALLVALALAGCDGSTTTPAPDAFVPSTLVATRASFQGFRTWTAFHEDGPAPGTVSVDALGPRMQYLNHVPEHGVAAFPVGTVIVEVRESGDRNIFAGVKRGGGYNASGAPGWEWFELAEAADGAVSIAWRGLGPPPGSTTYGNGGSARCNVCHRQCDDNDSVCSPSLQLARF